MKKLLTLCFGLVMLSAAAQKHQKLYYRKFDGTYLVSKEGADYM